MAKNQGALLLGVAALAAFAMKKKKKKKGTPVDTGVGVDQVEPSIPDGSDSSSPGVIELKGGVGPDPDPCVSDFYSQTATTLAPELAENISTKANSIYGASPVFFISHAAQLQAFEKLAYFMVNNPARKDAVDVVAADMAPNCDWSKSGESISGAQLAFYDSIGKMAQVISADLPEGVGHPHPWESNLPILADGDIKVRDTHPVGVLLPDDWGDVNVDAHPFEDMWGVESLGLASQKVEVSPGVYKYKMIYILRPIMGSVGKKHKTIRIRVTVTEALKSGSRSFIAGDLIVERDPSLG